MSDDATTWFLEAALAWVDTVDRAAERELAERVAVLASALSTLYLAGLHLPPATPPARALTAVPPPEDWPGLGSFEAHSVVAGHQVEDRWLSDDLLAAYGDVAAGLARFDDDADEALGWWRSGFERRWGPVAAAAIAPLHRAVLAFRDRPGRRGPRVPEIVPLATAPAPELRPFVGVQIAVADGGVEVVAVHPEGPAAGRLFPGDWLLAVDGDPLGGLGLDEVRARLAGEIGAERRIEVYRDDTTSWVTVVVAGRAADASPAGRPTSAGPDRATTPTGRRLVVRVLDRQGATRASQALQVLGCRITFAGDQLEVRAPATLADEDLLALLDAGRRAGVWTPG